MIERKWDIPNLAFADAINYQPGNRVILRGDGGAGTVKRVDYRYVHVTWDSAGIDWDGITCDGQAPAVPCLRSQIEPLEIGL